MHTHYTIIIIIYILFIIIILFLRSAGWKKKRTGDKSRRLFFGSFCFFFFLGPKFDWIPRRTRNYFRRIKTLKRDYIIRRANGPAIRTMVR